MARGSLRNLRSCYLCQPLFMDLSFQAVHTPLQAPQEYIDLYEDIENQERRILAGKNENVHYWWLVVVLYLVFYIRFFYPKFWEF